MVVFAHGATASDFDVFRRNADRGELVVTALPEVDVGIFPGDFFRNIFMHFFGKFVHGVTEFCATWAEGG